MLPNATGFGTVYDLRQAMALDSGLQDLLEQYTTETDPAAKDSLLDDLIYRWAGAADVDPYSRDPTQVYGHVMDARQLVTLEHLVGHSYLGTWCWGERDPNPHGQAAPLLIAEYLEFKKYTAAQLLAQTTYADDLDGIIQSAFGSDAQGVAVDWDALQIRLEELLDADEDDKIAGIVSVIYDLGNYSSSYRNERNAAFQAIGVSDPDLLPFLNFSTLAGTANADTLNGVNSGTHFYGLAGDDRLYGATGNDVYHFSKGQGNDVILDKGGIDQIAFGSGITQADIEFSRDTTSVWIHVKNTDGSDAGSLQIDNFFDFNGSIDFGQIESIQFADGSSLSQSQIVALLTSSPPSANADYIFGTAGNDTIDALAGNDNLHGLEGNDTLSGGDGSDGIFGDDGNDTLIGGTGDDSMVGGRGSDDYVFGVGHGNDIIDNASESAGTKVDRIVFEAGILPGDVTPRQSGADLIIQTSASSSITVKNYFRADAGDGTAIDQIVFDNGTTWSIADMKLAVLNGGTGNDTIKGYSSNDAIHGGDGDDSLLGQGGGDTLYGENGNDALNGGDGDDSLFGAAGNDRLTGDAGADLLDGGSGNDLLYGYAGNDTLRGGEGDDTLDGGAGSDNYVFDLGDGQDIINSYDVSSGRVDSLTFGEGIESSQVTARRSDDNLILTINETNDRVTIANFFYNEAVGGHQIDEIRFSDASSTVWSVADVKLKVLGPTSGDDTLQGYVSDDLILGGDGSDTINGNGGNDTLRGQAGTDNLQGGNGDDTLEGGIGNDSLDGGSGSDTYVFNAGDGRDTVSNYDASSGRVDVLSFGSSIDPTDVTARRVNSDLVLTFAGGDDKVTVSNYFVSDADGYYQVDEIRFSDTNNTVWSVADVKLKVLEPTAGADNLQGYATDDVIAGGDGNDTLYGNGGNDTLSGDTGDDAVHGGDGNDTAAGGAGADTLYGDAGDDQLDGGADNDALYGGAGSDHLTGGLGNDQLEGGDGDDHYHFAVGDGQDTINDTQGLSTIHLSGLPLEDVYLRRDGTALVLHFISSSNDQIRLPGFFDANTELALRGLVVDTGDGTPWTLDAAAIDAAVLLGTSLDDVIDGNTLDNTVGGLAGNDTLRGSAGADSLDGGAGNDALYGQAGNDVLAGGDGNDLLDGGVGADQLTGGIGDDTYVVDDVGDSVTEAADAGLDIVQSSVSFVLPDNVEQLTLTGSADIDGTGNALDNALTGNSGNNDLQGLSGNDLLAGNDGDDTLAGGAGNDQLDGGYGADVLDGGTGDDLLEGGTGIDQLTGGTGNDTYRVDETDDVIVELAGEGTDAVESTAYSYALSTNIETLTLVEGSSAYEGTGNALDNVLTGNSNGNRLDGGEGADTLVGGLGDDTYVIDQTGDVIVENADEGDDTVESGITYTLGETLENLTLTGSAGIDATGNAADNVIYGNVGNNQIDGGAGADTLYGGEGDDYYVAVSASDSVHEYAGEGIDTVERVFETNLVLDNNVENLILGTGITTGNGNDLDNVITGNTGDNTLGGWDGDDTLYGLDGDDNLFGVNGDDALYGGAGDDYLDGGTGIDTLEGGAGNDNYIVDDADDVVVEASGAGTDQVQASSSYALSANIENLFLTGSAAIDGVGNDLDNYIAGNGAANTIDGGAGDDTLVAGGGNDSLVGGAGDDKYVFDASSGSDVIDNSDGGFDGVFFTDGITRERLSFGRDGDDLLIFVDAASTPAVRVLNHFLGGDAAIDYVQPDGGYYLTTTEINQIVAGGSGGEYDQVIEGTASGEQLVGSSGKDLIKGLAGDDQLFGMGGNDTLQGGDGDDYLAGGNGSGTGSGDDRLEGGAGADTLTGQDGANTLIGGAGDDDYVYGGGQDTIDNTGGGYDGVFFNDNDAEDLTFARDGDDLVITVAGNATGFVRVTGHFLGGDSALDFVQPVSGGLLDTAAINALADPEGGGGDPGGGGNEGDDGDYPNVVDGTSAGEQLLGSSGRDLIHGLAGDDTVFGFGGDDKLVGDDGDDYLSGGNGSFSGSGSDILIGGAGADTLVGEDGDDMLIGGTGDDFYYYAEGSDADTVDNTGGGTDWLYFADIDGSRLSYHQDGDDLVVTVDDDLSQSIRVLNHFLGGDSAISYVQPSSGYAISASQIAGMLTPMPDDLQGGGSSMSTMVVSVQRLALNDDTAAAPESGTEPATAPALASLIARPTALDIFHTADDGQALQQKIASLQAQGHPSSTTPMARRPLLRGRAWLGKSPFASVWDEMDAIWQREPLVLSGRYTPLTERAVATAAGHVTPASERPPELDRLISAMAGFREHETDVAMVPVQERHQHPQLVASVV